jgi:hypothetical protein
MFDDIQIDEVDQEEILKKDNVVTLDDIFNGNPSDEAHESDTNEDEFHEKFMRELKKKEYMDKM